MTRVSLLAENPDEYGAALAGYPGVELIATLEPTGVMADAGSFVSAAQRSDCLIIAAGLPDWSVLTAVPDGTTVRIIESPSLRLEEMESLTGFLSPEAIRWGPIQRYSAPSLTVRSLVAGTDFGEPVFVRCTVLGEMGPESEGMLSALMDLVSFWTGKEPESVHVRTNPANGDFAASLVRYPEGLTALCEVGRSETAASEVFVQGTRGALNLPVGGSNPDLLASGAERLDAFHRALDVWLGARLESTRDPLSVARTLKVSMAAGEVVELEGRAS